ncbi:MAG: UDP-4-amino-4,6-dideoxy-N-acetyl-beta-L-altrosamine N-acetyltransferase [Chitinispirillales bacterium]|jgi:UDP-4-amino-4,6-dideoxy-N-acetyl-beta-L-altrosamine N-acetyltransferase|nr:UDP-4-amino-4,6-dideoxy-N-acetyl-beta-L-altrosamine N-acetyltransferase [Chitinispirillales bacterium]
MSKIYELIPLTDLDRTAQLRVLNIRNEEFIREWMFTEGVISEAEHLAWIERLKADQSQICLVIVDEHTCPFGAVNLKKIDKRHKSAELGFYKTRNINEKGLMAKSLAALIDYSFDTLGLEKIYTEVFDGNLKSLNIHKMLLFTEEGFLRSHIVNGEKRIGLRLFGLLKNEWQKGKGRINIRNDITIHPIKRINGECDTIDGKDGV